MDGSSDKQRGAEEMRSRKTGTIGRDCSSKETVLGGKEDRTVIVVQSGAVLGKLQERLRQEEEGRD